MVTLTISLSDDEMKRLEALCGHEGLAVEQIVRLSINDFLGLPDETFSTAAKRVMEKNTEFYCRPA